MAKTTIKKSRIFFLDIIFLFPIAFLAAIIGFLLSSTLAAWVFPDALPRIGIGVLAAILFPALLSIGNGVRFFAKSLITVNLATILGLVLLFPEGLQEAVRHNGDWPAKAVAPYLPSPQQDQVKKEAARIATLLAEKIPDGPGALSYLLPPFLESSPQGTIKSESNSSSGAVIKFKKRGASIILNATLNDKLSVPLIYDTGASLTTLDKKTAKKLGISTKGARTITVETANGITRQPIITLSSIQVGGARVEGPIEVAICDTCSLSKASGLLGLNFSRAFITEIDPQAGSITFRPRK